ncbi:hypothetical protein B0T16DRAFT_462803 [Cercophora newfieldiana]|uniref:Uncharacterized protein n=1 Tax=Cercophora newfieldiana TaxID=92897 RepID=A0AA39XS40_9PEZI|nr:hypothetical protein B0T16DRAFT_462803 [Cercophora newfieldiana]
MSKVRPATKKAAGLAAPKPAPTLKAAKTPKVGKTAEASKPEQPKSKYVAGTEPEDNLSRAPPKRTEDKLQETFKGLLSQQDRTTDASASTMGAESLERYLKQLGLSLVDIIPASADNAAGGLTKPPNGIKFDAFVKRTEDRWKTFVLEGWLRGVLDWTMIHYSLEEGEENRYICNETE